MFVPFLFLLGLFCNNASFCSKTREFLLLELNKVNLKILNLIKGQFILIHKILISGEESTSKIKHQ